MGAPEEQKKKPQRVRRGLINVQKQSAQDKFQLMSNEFGEGDMRDLQEEDLRFLQDDMSMSMSMPKKGKSKSKGMMSRRR